MREKTESIEVTLRYHGKLFGWRGVIRYKTQDEKKKEINYIRLRIRANIERMGVKG